VIIMIILLTTLNSKIVTKVKQTFKVILKYNRVVLSQLYFIKNIQRYDKYSVN